VLQTKLANWLAILGLPHTVKSGSMLRPIHLVDVHGLAIQAAPTVNTSLILLMLLRLMERPQVFTAHTTNGRVLLVTLIHALASVTFHSGTLTTITAHHSVISKLSVAGQDQTLNNSREIPLLAVLESISITIDQLK